MCLGMKETTQISTRGDTEARSDFDKRDDSEGRAVSDHDQRRSTASATRRRSSGRATALPRPRQGDAVADFAAHPNRFGRGRGGRIRGKAVRKRGSNEAGGAVVAAKSPWWWRLAAHTRSGPCCTCRDQPPPPPPPLLPQARSHSSISRSAPGPLQGQG